MLDGPASPLPLLELGGPKGGCLSFPSFRFHHLIFQKPPTAFWDFLLELLLLSLLSGLAVKPGKPVERLLLRRPIVLERKRVVVSSGGSSSGCSVSANIVKARRGGLPGEGFASSSWSSPHISSASASRTVFRTFLVAPRTVSSFVVGVIGSPFSKA